jgi:predicted nucleic acid-binding protein
MLERLRNLRVISNTSPLIYLSKIGKLELLRDIYSTVYVPGAVATEILRGKELSNGFASAIEVEGAIDNGWIQVIELDAKEENVAEKYSIDPGIHPGEAVVLAVGHRFDLLLLDDLGARTFAKALGFDIVGTIGIILQAYDYGLMSFNEFEESLDDLVHYDFWIHPHLKRRIMSEAESIKNLKNI